MSVIPAFIVAFKTAFH